MLVSPTLRRGLELVREEAHIRITHQLGGHVLNLVMDTMFCDSLEFTLSAEDVATIPPMPSMEQTFNLACEFVGIELLSYERASITRNAQSGTVTVLIVGLLWVNQRQR